MSHEVIEMLGVALAVPVVLGLLTLGMERVERRLDRPLAARPLAARPQRRVVPRAVATRPSLTRTELPLY